MRRRAYVLWRVVAQFLALACAAGVLAYGIAANSGRLVTCESPWQRMRPQDTCVDTDDEGHERTYTYSEWKPVMESKALVFVIFGILGISATVVWVGVGLFPPYRRRPD